MVEIGAVAQIESGVGIEDAQTTHQKKDQAKGVDPVRYPDPDSVPIEDIVGAGGREPSAVGTPSPTGARADSAADWIVMPLASWLTEGLPHRLFGAGNGRALQNPGILSGMMGQVAPQMFKHAIGQGGDIRRGRRPVAPIDWVSGFPVLAQGWRFGPWPRHSPSAHTFCPKKHARMTSSTVENAECAKAPTLLPKILSVFVSAVRPSGWLSAGRDAAQ